MRKWLAIVCLLAVSSAGASALSYSVGVRGGTSGSFLFGSYADALSASLTGMGAGTVAPQPYISYRADVFFRLGIWDFFAVQAEVGFGPIGGAMLASNGYDLLLGVTVNELSVPILAVYLLQTPIGTFSFAAGIFAAYPIGDPLLIENNGLVRTESGLLPAIYGGVAAGVGYQFKLGPGAVVADLRYTHRLLSLVDTAAIGDNALVPFAVELSAGYMFTF